MTKGREQPLSIAARVRTLRRRKTVMAVALPLGVCLPYYALQRGIFFPVTTIEATALDRLIPFHPGASWAYLSVYLLMPIVPLLMTTKPQLRGYALGICAISLVADSIFFFFPTSLARPATGEMNWGYSLIVAIDRPFNIRPSLHAALGVFSALCGESLLPELHRHTFWRLAMWVWTLVILGATLVTKQHVILDILIGALLALVSYIAFCRRQESRQAALSQSLASGDCRRKARAAQEGGYQERKEAGMENDTTISLLTARARADLACGIEPQMASLRTLDWKKRLPQLAFISLLCTAGVTINCLSFKVSAGGAGLRLAGVIATAIALNGCVLLLHEGMHHALFKNRFVNWCGAVCCGATVFISFTAYQVMHARHHTYLGDWRDPDDYHNYTRNRRLLWLLHYVRLFFGAPLYILLIPVLAYRHGSPSARRRIVIEYGLLGLAYLWLWLSVPSHLLLSVWLIPLVLVAMMVNIRGFAQHGLTDASDPLLASRSIEAHPIVAFCLLYENYHLEHHLFPEIPSYGLARLHTLIWHRLPRVVTGSSYLGFLGSFFRATLRADETPVGLRLRDRHKPGAEGL